MKEEILQLYKKYHSGKENAITRYEFIEKHSWILPGRGDLGLWFMTDREFRNIYRTCDKGGFYPIRKEEILEYRDYLRKKAIPLFERWNRVRAAHPDLVGNEKQLELFEVGESHDR